MPVRSANEQARRHEAPLIFADYIHHHIGGGMILGRKKESDDPSELLARKEYGKAVKIYSEKLKKQPRNTNIKLSLADALLAWGKVDEAIREYRDLAEFYAHDSHIIKAIAIYKKILRLRPDMTEIEQSLLKLSDWREQPSKSSGAFSKVRDDSSKSGLLQSKAQSETQLFLNLTTEEFEDIVKRLALRHYDKETTIFEEGDPGNSLFIIVSGEVRVVTRDRSGKKIVLANLKEGQFFGEISLLTGRPRTASIITSSGSDLLELTRSDYERIVRKHPHLKEVLKDYHHQRAKDTAKTMIQASKNR